MSVAMPILVLWGALATASWVAGLFFLHFWKSSRDRLFVFFALAFWLLCLNWLGLAFLRWSEETRHQVYLLRLLAFILILVGVFDKNRRVEAKSTESPRGHARPERLVSSGSRRGPQ